MGLQIFLTACCLAPYLEHIMPEHFELSILRFTLSSFSMLFCTVILKTQNYPPSCQRERNKVVTEKY